MTNAMASDKIKFEELTKAQKALIDYCMELGWGKFEIIVKDGEPVMVISSQKDIKLD